MSGQIDCSHGNSSKQHAKQIEVAENIVCCCALARTEPWTEN